LTSVPTKFQPLVEIAYGILPKLVCNRGGSHHFSFILKSSKVLAVGVNQPEKTHVFAARYGYRFSSIHSELMAVNRLRHKTDFSKCRMVNIRLSSLSIKSRQPILRMSKPCLICQSWLSALNFKDIYYSTNNGFDKM
jgi:hypothetical protein